MYRAKMVPDLEALRVNLSWEESDKYVIAMFISQDVLYTTFVASSTKAMAESSTIK